LNRLTVRRGLPQKDDLRCEQHVAGEQSRKTRKRFSIRAGNFSLRWIVPLLNQSSAGHLTAAGAGVTVGVAVGVGAPTARRVLKIDIITNAPTARMSSFHVAIALLTGPP
jgi:hypothetical protein